MEIEGERTRRHIERQAEKARRKEARKGSVLPKLGLSKRKKGGGTKFMDSLAEQKRQLVDIVSTVGVLRGKRASAPESFGLGSAYSLTAS